MRTICTVKQVNPSAIQSETEQLQAATMVAPGRAVDGDHCLQLEVMGQEHVAWEVNTQVALITVSEHL